MRASLGLALLVVAAAALAAGGALGATVDDTAVAKARRAQRTATTAVSAASASASMKNDFRGQGAAATVCVSWGDTHMQPFGGQSYYNIYDLRPFLLAGNRYWPKTNKPESLFEVHVKQSKAGWAWPRTVDNDFGVRCGRDHVQIFNPRDGRSVQVLVNHEDVSDRVAAGQVIKLPSAPKNAGTNRFGRPAYSLFGSASGSFRYIYVDCRHDRAPASANDYVSGFLLTVSYRMTTSTQWIYGNAKLEAQPFWGRKLEGACGWAANSAQPSRRTHFLSGNTLLEKNPDAVSKMAAQGKVKVLDPDKLTKKKNECIKMIADATGVDIRNLPPRFKEVDKDVEKELDNYAQGCAADAYFGVAHDTDDMMENVCDWVDDVKDMLDEEVEQKEDEVRKCKGEVKDLQPLYDEEYELAAFCLNGGARPPRRTARASDFSANCKNRVAGSPMEQINKLLKNMYEAIEEQQKADFAELLTEARRFSANYRSVSSTLSAKQSTAKSKDRICRSFQPRINAFTDERSSLLVKQSDRREKLAAWETELDRRSKERAAQHDSYEQEALDTKGLIKLLETVRQKVSTVKSVFLEESEGAALLARVGAKKSDGASSGKLSRFAERAAEVVQRAQAVLKDKSGVSANNKAALLRLCNVLIAELQKYLKELTEEETNAQRQWVLDRNELNRARVRDTEALEAITNDIKHVQSDLDDAKSDRQDCYEELADVRRQIEPLKKSLSDLHRDFRVLVDEYVKQTKDRRTELKTLVDVMAALGMRTLSATVANRIKHLSAADEWGNPVAH